MMRVSIYTTPFCPYCRSAKALLRTLGVRYREIDLSRDAAAREELRRLTGRMSFPQVLIDGEPVGGYRELTALAAAGGLDRLRRKAA